VTDNTAFAAWQVNISHTWGDRIYRSRSYFRPAKYNCRQQRELSGVARDLAGAPVVAAAAAAAE